MERKEILSLIGGAVAGTVFDLVIDFPLASIGALRAWKIFDSKGRYVWGVGTGDILGVAVGAGLTLSGHALKKRGRPYGEQIRTAGIAWLLALGCIKLAELYGYLRIIYPITEQFGMETVTLTVPLLKEI